MVQIASKAKRGRNAIYRRSVRAMFVSAIVLALFFAYNDPTNIQAQPVTPINGANYSADAVMPKSRNGIPDWKPNHNFGRFRSYQSLAGSRPVPQSTPGDPLDPLIEYGNGWDVSPVVVERYRLIFFTIPKTGTTVFKQLFRRMMGHDDWVNDKDPNLPHNPQFNGLRYLYNYPYNKVLEFMNSSNWTRAIFVRDPKDRLLSAFLDKGVDNNAKYIKRKCCGIKPKNEEDSASFKIWQKEHQKRMEIQLKSSNRNNQRSSSSNLFLAHGFNGDSNRRQLREIDMGHIHAMASKSSSIRRRDSLLDGKESPSVCSNLTSNDATLDFQTFVLHILPACSDPHWMPQSLRIDESLWKHINFIGHFDRLKEDTKKLLLRIGAWEKYGASGWPQGGSIFATNSARHKTKAHEKIDKYYTPRLEKIVYDYYKDDYEHPLLNLSKPT